MFDGRLDKRSVNEVGEEILVEGVDKLGQEGLACTALLGIKSGIKLFLAVNSTENIHI